MNREQLIAEALSLPLNSIAYFVSQRLADSFPEKALIETEEHYFNVEKYAQAGHCRLELKASIYNQVVTNWEGPEEGTEDRAMNAWCEVEWQGATLEVLLMHWYLDFSRVSYNWIVADSEEIAKNFLETVCKWNMEVRGEVLVFNQSCWYKDEKLFRAIKDATFDNLVLRGSLKQDIREDLEQFFASRATYEAYGVPWKRGILFVGTPGNGKTHAVKALINAMNQPCLYVKSFKYEYSTDEENISKVFEQARKSAPCILVLEDLDSLVTPQNRSFFLNELDGFAANVGIVTLATTNHPERLDPSILDRPSRFDRKYPFDLPALAERQAYITLWNNSLEQTLRLSNAAAAQVAELTEGFSFAYLKELFLSSIMRWIATQQSGAMDSIMIGQVDLLREQMLSASMVPDDAGSDGEDGKTQTKRVYIYRDRKIF